MKIECAHDEVVDLDLLIPNPKNPNKHPDNQIKLLAKIMNHQGWRSPIVVSNRSGFITKGHGRMMAAKVNGWSQAPVDRQDYATEADEYADMVADNKIAELAETDMMMVNTDAMALGPDFDLELLGIPDFEIDTSDPFEAQSDENEVPTNAEQRTKLGNIFALGEHRLMCGSSTDMESVNKLFNGNRATLCFTSPPYSDMRDYNGGKDLSTDHLARFLEAPANLFIMNLGIQRKDKNIFPYWDAYINHAKSIGLNFLAWNVWDKLEAGSIGNQSAIFPLEHEWIFVFGKEKIDINKTEPTKHAGVFKTKHTGSRNKDGTLEYKYNPNAVSEFKKMGSVYRASPEKARNLGHDHPAVFPVHFPESFILACTDKNEIVYEPFCGSGTTLIAAQKSNRTCFGMELDPKYCDIILARWEKYTGKKAELLNG